MAKNKKQVKIISRDEVKRLMPYYKTEVDFRADLERYAPVLIEQWGKKKWDQFINDPKEGMRGWHGKKSGVGTKFQADATSPLKFHLNEYNPQLKDQIAYLSTRKIGTTGNPWQYFYQNGKRGLTKKNVTPSMQADYIMKELVGQYNTAKDFHADIERYEPVLKAMWGPDVFKQFVMKADKLRTIKHAKNFKAPKASPLHSYLSAVKPDARGVLNDRRKLKVGEEGGVKWSHFPHYGGERDVVSKLNPLSVQSDLGRERIDESSWWQKDPQTRATVEGFVEGLSYNKDIIDTGRVTNEGFEAWEDVGQFAGNLSREVLLSYVSAGVVNSLSQAAAGLPWLHKALTTGGYSANQLHKFIETTHSIPTLGKLAEVGLKGVAKSAVKSTLDSILNPGGANAKDFFKSMSQWGAGDVGRALAEGVVKTYFPNVAPSMLNLIGYVADTTGSVLGSIPFTEKDRLGELWKEALSPQVIAMGLVDSITFAVGQGMMKDGPTLKKDLAEADWYIKQFEETGNKYYLMVGYSKLDKVWKDNIPSEFLEDVNFGDMWLAKLKDNLSNVRYAEVDADLVKSTQRVLADLGYDTPIDGVRSDKFNEALTSFQKKMGLPVTPDIVFSGFDDAIATARQWKADGTWTPSDGPENITPNTPPPRADTSLITARPESGSNAQGSSNVDWYNPPTYNYNLDIFLKDKPEYASTSRTLNKKIQPPKTTVRSPDGSVTEEEEEKTISSRPIQTPVERPEEITTPNVTTTVAEEDKTAIEQAKKQDGDYSLQYFASADNPNEVDENKVAIKVLQDMRLEGVNNGDLDFVEYVDKQISVINEKINTQQDDFKMPPPGADKTDDTGTGLSSAAVMGSGGGENNSSSGDGSIPPDNDSVWNTDFPEEDDPTIDYLDDDEIGALPEDDTDYDIGPRPSDEREPLELGGNDQNVNNIKVDIPPVGLTPPPNNIPDDVKAVADFYDKGSTFKEVYEYANTHKPDNDGWHPNTTKYEAQTDILRTMNFITGGQKELTRMNMELMKAQALGDDAAVQNALEEQRRLQPILAQLPHAVTRARQFYLYLGNQVIGEAVRINDNPSQVTDEDLARYAASRAQLQELSDLFNYENVPNIARTLAAMRLTIGDDIAYNGRVSKGTAFASYDTEATARKVRNAIDIFGGRDQILKDAKHTAKYINKSLTEFLKDMGVLGDKPKKNPSKMFPLTAALLETAMASVLGPATLIRNEVAQAISEMYSTYYKLPISWFVDEILQRGGAEITIDEVIGEMVGSFTGFWEGVFGPLFPGLNVTTSIDTNELNKLLRQDKDLKIHTVLDILKKMLHDPRGALFDLEEAINRTGTDGSKITKEKANTGKSVSKAALENSTTGKILTAAANLLNAPLQAINYAVGNPQGLSLRFDSKMTPTANYLWYFIDVIGSISRIKSFGGLGIGDRKYYNAGYLGKLGGIIGRIKHQLPYVDDGRKTILADGKTHIKAFQDELRRKVLAYNTIQKVYPAVEAYALKKESDPIKQDQLKTQLLDEATDGLYSEIKAADGDAIDEIEDIKALVQQATKVVKGTAKPDSFYFEHPETGEVLTPVEFLEDYAVKRLEELNTEDIKHLKKVPPITSKLLKAIHEQCVAQADDRTFKSPLDVKFYKGVENLMINNPEVRLVTMLYVHTPLKITETAQWETPVIQLALPKFREALTSEDPVENNRALTSFVAGTIASIILYLTYKTGQITPIASDSNERRRMREAGIPEHSVKIWGKWFDWSSLDPYIGHFLGITTSAARALEQAKDDEEFSKIASSFVMALVFASFEKTWMQGLTNFFDVTRGRANPNFIGNLANIFFPFAAERKLTNKGGLIGDPTTEIMMETKGWLDGFNKTSRPRLDTFGKEQPVERHVLGYRYQGDTQRLTSPIRNELVRLKMSLPEQSDTPLNLKHPLPPAMHHALVRGLETVVKAEDELNDLVTSQEYRDMTNDDERKDAIKDLWRDLKQANIDDFINESAQFRELLDKADEEDYERAMKGDNFGDNVESWAKELTRIR